MHNYFTNQNIVSPECNILIGSRKNDINEEIPLNAISNYIFVYCLLLTTGN